MYSLQTLTGFNILCSHSNNPSVSASRYHASPISCSLASQKIPVEPLKSESKNEDFTSRGDGFTLKEQLNNSSVEQDGEKGGGEDKGISGIYVPRQKYIAVSKADLLDGILSMFKSKEEADEFLRFSMCLDSILHAEHKGILEEMRVYYSHTRSDEKKGAEVFSSLRLEQAISSGQQSASDSAFGSERMGVNGQGMDKHVKQLQFQNGLDLRFLFDAWSTNGNSDGESRVAVQAHFQRAFMKILRGAQFEELSAQDLLLTHALNTDYLLTLPIYVDWKREAESKAVIFRRGYSSERQKGFLIVEKLEYLQSKLLQEIFVILSRPLKTISIWINKALESSSQTQEIQIWIQRAKHWLKEKYFPKSMHSYVEGAVSEQLEADRIADSELPIWLAAQRAVPRYEGLLSSVGPRGRLLRKLLMWVGLIPSMPEIALELDDDSKISENYLRPNFLSRITLNDLWKPASRESCGNNLWEMVKMGVSILFSQSVLQEPTFQELILLYTEEASQRESEEEVEVLPLQLKIYERIPIPDLPVIFPHKKLSFRILDTVRLDVASIVGLLAFFVNYKFVDIGLSPSAIWLDVIAISALIIYVTRVVLGYKQTWDRYQLLVNRTLYEKTLASGFGSVHFLLDASEQQQYKEAILAYALLLHAENYQVSCRKSIGDACERFMYDKFKEKVEMPIDDAVDILLRLDLVTEFPTEGSLKLEVLSCSKACETLKRRWDSLLERKA